MPRPSKSLARDVVTNPHRYRNIPNAYADAWAALKAQRGQTVDYTRLRGTGHWPDDPSDPSPLAQDLADRAPRIRAYVQKRMTGGAA